VRLFGMTYYDPALALWLQGTTGRAVARLSQAATVAKLGPLLTSVYRGAGMRTADVSGRFRTGDFSLTGTYKGKRVPRNVANVCNWTHTCENVLDIHPNGSGHDAIAKAFESLVDAR
jgi:hypothetical protein